MTRVLLTGASGFIGSHVARCLLGKQVQLLAMVRPNSDHRRIDDILTKLELLEGSIEDCEALRDEIARFAPEICIHLAWQSPGKLDNDQNDERALEGSLRLLKLLQATECRRFITAGTYTEYCSSTAPVSEQAPICPATFYAKCKYDLETTAQEMQQEAGREFCSTRLFNVYGPWDNERRMIPSIIASIDKGQLCELRTGGQQIRDFSHVEDVADAICAVAEAKLQGIVNIGSSVPSSAASVGRLVAELMGHPELLKLSDQPLPPHEAACLVANTSRLRAETDWRPRFDLRTGIQQTIGWYRA